MTNAEQIAPIPAKWTDHSFVLPDGFELSKTTVDGLTIVSVGHSSSNLHVDMLDNGPDDPITAYRLATAIDTLRRSMAGEVHGLHYGPGWVPTSSEFNISVKEKI